MRGMVSAGLLALLGWVVCPVVADTPVGWRSDGTGCFTAAMPPSEWSSSKNVMWKVALPGASYGAPIVVGDNLYVASDPGELLCIRRKDGKVLWRMGHADVKAPVARGSRGGFGGGRGGGGRTAGNTAATPVSNGKYVATVFGNGVVATYTPEGKRVWARFIESPRIDHGLSASPLLIDDKLIVHIKDLVALNVATGKETWRVALTATHASPVLARLDKEDVVISPAGAVVRVSDGKVLGKGAFRSSDNSPVVIGDTVCVAGRGAFKLSLTKEGTVKVASLWSGSEGAQDGGDRDGGRGRGRGRGMGGRDRGLASPLVHDGLLYGVNTRGILEVVDAKTGKSFYRERLPVGQVYASLALAGGLLYVLDLEGKTVVFKPGRKYERVAVNRLEGTGSCPVFAGDHLYVRGRRDLYCLSAKTVEAKPKD